VWAASLFVAYNLIGFLILPVCIRFFGARQIAHQLDRSAQIKSVRINPYVLSLRIRGLLVQDKDGQPFVSWDEFYANFQLSSFFRKPWVFKEVRLVHPFVRARMNKDYTLNFSDLVKKFSTESGPPKPSKPLFLEIEQLNITGALVSITDLTPRVPFHHNIGPVELTVTRFRTEPQSQNPYSFSGTTDSGERFTWSGSFSLDPIRSFGELAMQGVSIPRYAALYQDMTRFDIPQGTVSFQSAYDVALTSSNALATITNASFLLQGFKLVDRSNKTEVLDLDALRVRGMSASLSSRSTEISEVAVSGGRINVRRDRDDRINLIDLSQPAEDFTNAPGGILTLLKAATNVFAAFLGSTNLWSATLHELNVTNCELRGEDLANRRPVHLDLDQVSVSAHELSNLPGSNQTVSLTLRWNTNGTIRVDSAIRIQPPTADVDLSVHNLELKPLDPYLEPFVNIFIVDSKVNLDGRLSLRSTNGALPEVAFRGDAGLDDFATVDAKMAEDLVKWRSIQASGMNAVLQPPTVAVKQITMVDPLARIAIETNGAINVLSALRFGETNASKERVAPAAPAQSGRQPSGSLGQKLGGFLRELLAGGTNGLGGGALPKITLETLAITNGSAEFHDRSTQPPVTALISELNGTIKGLTSEELRQADLNLAGRIDRTGQFEVIGKLNPLMKNTPTDLKVNLHGVNLVPASPYAGRFLGYRLTGGKLDLQVSYTISDQRLDAKNVLGIDHFTLGEKVESPDATHLPVKLAVALLKDRNGKIELDVPIEGNLDDPEFHYGKVISRVVVNIITKLVTSPFAVLGAIFGGKGEEVSYQDFAAGEVELQASQADKLEALINGLTERPGLQLAIEGSFDPVSDAEGLRRQKLRKQFRSNKWAGLRRSEQAETSPEQISLSDEEYQAYVQTAYRAMIQTNPAPDKAEAGDLKTKQVERTAVAVTDTTDLKGAAALMKRPVSTPNLSATDMEKALLDTIPVTNDDLNQLALERARRAQQKILGSGKIEAERISLKPSDSGDASKPAARVYFHLE
jgi:hypothetical protein